MNVLSLFDGMSCGQIALNRVGINYENYFSSEIKRHAIKVAQHNYPKTIQLGDIREIVSTELPKMDLLIGGSPCQDFSIARTVNGNTRAGLQGEKSRLFFEYVRLLRELNPTYFLLENVNMDEYNKNYISNLLEVEPICIDSQLVSYQKRRRLYWTNIPNITLPDDKHISFQDYKDVEYDYCKKFKVNKTKSREVMWGDGINGRCPNVTNSNKINCLTVKQESWNKLRLCLLDTPLRYHLDKRKTSSEMVGQLMSLHIFFKDLNETIQTLQEMEHQILPLGD